VTLEACATRRLGIALIHQELMRPQLDITANIFLATSLLPRLLAPLPTGISSGARWTCSPASAARAGGLASRRSAPDDADGRDPQALSLNARILVMDEPTSSLTAAESAHLFEIVRQLRADGLGIVYISHRMEEVLELADRITVLRDGRAVGDLEGDVATHETVVAMMVGENEPSLLSDRRTANSDVVFLRETSWCGRAGTW
jgi:ribose transport system ATP-binding protein